MDEILSVMKMVDAVVVGCRCCIGMANGVGYYLLLFIGYGGRRRSVIDGWSDGDGSDGRLGASAFVVCVGDTP